MAVPNKNLLLQLLPVESYQSESSQQQQNVFMLINKAHRAQSKQEHMHN